MEKPSYYLKDYQPLVLPTENFEFYVSKRKEYDLSQFKKHLKIMALFNSFYVLFLICYPFNIIKALLIISCVICAGVDLYLYKETLAVGFQSVIINNIINAEFSFFYCLYMLFIKNYFVVGFCAFSIIVFLLETVFCSIVFVKFMASSKK